MIRLRLLLVVFFLALAIPSGVLIHQAYGQMQWEAFHQQRLLAEELAGRIDERFQTLTEVEESRSFADYGFLVVSGDPSANFLQRSALSSFPPDSRLPGLLAHFQVDASGVFTTPLLPEEGTGFESLGIPRDESAARLALGRKVHALLSQRNLVQRHAYTAPALESVVTVGESGKLLIAEEAEFMALEASSFEDLEPEALPEDPSFGFDELKKSSELLASSTETVAAESQSLGRLADLNLDATYATQAQKEVPVKDSDTKVLTRSKRREQAVVPQSNQAPEQTIESFGSVSVSTFDTEIDPFSFAVLDARHFVLFRHVWREGERYVQGAVIEKERFMTELIKSPFRATTLSSVSDLVVGYKTEVLRVFPSLSIPARNSSAQLLDSLLYQIKLSPPFSGLELIFSVTQLPLGPGGTVIVWTAFILFGVLVAGFVIMYRLGVGQIRLHRQQQDFVSAVSHELKTPLTSIRMYGEMLRAGWVDEEKKRSYYDFIFYESERLSRLIANVLQLARMTRSTTVLDCKPISARALVELIESKVSTQITHAGFALILEGDDLETVDVSVDVDAFSQIFINLVDNALKFSNPAANKTIELSARCESDRAVVFSIRDFGPGIAKDQLKKIFKLFYRPESELTRETVGTGIGLALVHQLASAMRGKVDVINRDPGAQFRVTIPQS